MCDWGNPDPGPSYYEIMMAKKARKSQRKKKAVKSRKKKAVKSRKKKWVKHIVREGARVHVLSWDQRGTHCSETNCEVNDRTKRAQLGRRT